MVSVVVSTLVVEWIEMHLFTLLCGKEMSSPPSWWSGLKFLFWKVLTVYWLVSTLVVEWIEICNAYGALCR